MATFRGCIPVQRIEYFSVFSSLLWYYVSTMTEVLPQFNSSRNHPDKITILLADDHPLLRLALRSVLEKQDDFEIVAEAGDGEEAVRLAAELVPNVVIMDISMPKLNGLEATRQIKAECPDTAVLVLTVHSDSEHLLGIFEAGATGYLTKSVFGEEVVHTIHAVAAGESVLPVSMLKQLLKHTLRYGTKSLPLDEGEKLTIRELDIFGLLATGMSNKDIALRLDISLRTVKGYLVDIFSKLRVRSRTEAVITGLRAGFITLDDLE